MEEYIDEIAVFAGGCFWCTEAVFQRLEGVHKVISGYTGGELKNPTYREISTGKTGHAEAVKILFDPLIISYLDLLVVFFATHDPTTLNKQGADLGTQYRSSIFYMNESQKKIAENTIHDIENKRVFKDSIVTSVTKLEKFYKAEDYHQNYYNQNATQGYCQFVINPKLYKLQNAFQNKIKKNSKIN